jgi:starch phosphorylase
MKVLVNGGLNLSELDGWWAEAYSPEVGWALGDGKEHGGDPAWDAAEADALYDLLEREVIPEFYDCNEEGTSTAWVARMRESMARLTPHYSAGRTVREYTASHYLPAADAYHARSENACALGTRIANWLRALDRDWSSIGFGEITCNSSQDQHSFKVEVCLSGLDPAAVRVELYADDVNGQGPVRQTMTSLREVAPGRRLYGARVSSTRPATDYTPRIVPYYPGVSVPLEAPQVRWRH